VDLIEKVDDIFNLKGKSKTYLILLGLGMFILVEIFWGLF
tara:strand:+ start:1052 stop:1171 length:120 start_codon:yes stop_codon:yes gene_type:complete